MSIANEIIRIQDAKQAFKSNLQQRGITVESTDKIGTYVDLLNNVPYVLKGTLTPEEDLAKFEIDGLNFTPYVLVLTCKELEGYNVANAVVSGMVSKGNPGGIAFVNASGNSSYGGMKSTSTQVSWGNNSVVIEFQSSVTARFKTGYTYEYIIVGGIEQ